jgi:hypothetical protein
MTLMTVAASVVRVAGAIAVIAWIAQPGIAAADHCGGGGSSGGGSSGGSSGGWSGGTQVYAPSGSAVADPVCEDTSEVVGYRRCKKFGTWGVDTRIPHVSFEGGVAVRQFGSLLDDQTGKVVHGDEGFLYRVVTPTESRPVDTAVFSTLRLGVGMSHGLYSALEVGLGALAQPGRADTEMMTTGPRGSPELDQRRGFVVDTIATLGLRGTTGAGGLGVELAGGVRAASYTFHSSYISCEHDVSIRAVGPLAEARARGELWVNPWLTAGVTLGTSLLERGMWVGGLYLGVHSRAFGGGR